MDWTPPVTRRLHGVIETQANIRILETRDGFRMTITRRFYSDVVCAFLAVAFFSGCNLGPEQYGETIRFQDPSEPLAPYADIHVGAQKLPMDVDDFINDDFPVEQSNQSNARRPDASRTVLDVKIKGNQQVQEFELLRVIRTRPGRLFDPDLLRQDVDDLWKHPKIRRIDGPYIERTPNGVVVTIKVIEGRFINEVKFIGNRAITDRTLARQIDLKENGPLDVHQVRMARQQLEDYYREKGFNRTQVTIMEGDELEDNNVIFLVHEDEKQKIWDVDFVGNEFAWSSRLKTLIKSKPGTLKVFGGTMNRQELEQDLLRITTYYRSLGFFNAKIGREIEESSSGWVTIRFIIHEGPRYKVRNVSFVGNEKFTDEQLYQLCTLSPDGESADFNSAKMTTDTKTLKDAYGSQGHVFAEVIAEPRFLEEPGMLDLVYKIKEGKQYRVGKIYVNISGDYGITKKQVVLNRLSLRPGDIIDTRELERSKVRLRGSSLFAGGPSSPGPPPQIVVKPPELKQLERYAEQGNNTGY